MKNILITGENSYVGNNFQNYIQKFPNYQVTQLSVHGEKWKDFDFGQFDVVFHVAGIAHVTSNPTDKEKDMYYKINTELTNDVANKAK